jgi:isocitrate/isopropylmalate dehydrogenase
VIRPSPRVGSWKRGGSSRGTRRPHLFDPFAPRPSVYPFPGGPEPVTHDIALLPGDGIGPEVVDATVPLLGKLGERHGFDIDFTRYDWGSDRYLERGGMIPEDAPDRLRPHDAILLGAMGDPRVPDHVSSTEGHLVIRKAFDHYVNLRPARLYEGAPTPLAGYEGGDIDVLWFRENTEGEYVDIGGGSPAAVARRWRSRPRCSPTTASSGSPESRSRPRSVGRRR